MPDAERTPDVTPEILDVMSEPVRWRAYSLLVGLGPRRAGRLARKVSVSEASMLRHLRILREVGFVTSPDDSLPERHRLWSAVPGGVRLTEPVEHGQVDDSPMRRWVQVFVQAQHLLLREWVQDAETWPPEWREAAMNYGYWLHLDAAELEEMTREIFAVTDRWIAKSQHRPDSPDTDRKPVYLVANAFPVRD